MENTASQENATINNEQTDGKTFTQADVDAIVADRLKRERSKYEGYENYKAKAQRLDEIEEASKTELQKATEKANALETELQGLKKAESIRSIRDKVAHDTGVPANLLHGEDEDACKAEAKSILDFAKGNGYPTVKDGGETTVTGKKTTREQFADWLKNS